MLLQKKQLLLKEQAIRRHKRLMTYGKQSDKTELTVPIEQKSEDNQEIVLEPTFPHDTAKQNEQRAVDQAGSPLHGLSEDRTRLPDCSGFGSVLCLQE